jgi:RNA polymerase sigma-70 factor (ECF subfamily)
MDLRTEQILVEEAKRGKEAFANLYNHFYPQIFNFLRWRTNSKEDAEDLAMDVFEKVMKNLDKYEYREGYSFKSWIFRIADNLLTDYYRKNGKRQYSSLDEMETFIENGDESVEESSIKNSLYRQISNALKHFSETQRKIMELRLFAQMTNKEIAIHLNITENIVSTNIARATERLKKEINQ